MINADYNLYSQKTICHKTTWASTQYALDRLKEIILGFDTEASVCLNAEQACLQWNSSSLFQPVEVTVWEVLNNVMVYFCHHEFDNQHCQALIPCLSQQDVATAPSKPFQSVLEVVETIVQEGTWNGTVKVLPSAFKSAKDCPYIQLDRLYQVLNRLPALVHLRISSRGKSVEDLAKEVGLGNIYRAGISDTAELKFGHEYQFNYQGRRQFFREHLTLGGSCNDRHCMSVHFLWDATAQCLVIGHIGRHFTNRLTNT